MQLSWLLLLLLVGGCATVPQTWCEISQPGGVLFAQSQFWHCNRAGLWTLEQNITMTLTSDTVVSIPCAPRTVPVYACDNEADPSLDKYPNDANVCTPVVTFAGIVP